MMKINIRNLILSLLIILAPFVIDRVMACSCIEIDSPCNQAGKSSAVFVGKVVGAKEQKSNLAYDSEKDEPTVKAKTYDVGETYFEVQEAFAGVKKGTSITIYSSGFCDYQFERGETYLVYADGKLNRLVASHCSRTHRISVAEEDLPILRDLVREKPGAKVKGAILEEIGLSRYEGGEKTAPLAGIEFRLQPISEKGRIFKVKTDFEGKYELNGVSAGKYKIILPLSDQTKFTEQSILEIESTGFGCIMQLAMVENKNEISGKAIDDMGEPIFDLLKVELISADSDFTVRPRFNIPSKLAKLDVDGKFTFSGIPAGRYFLAVHYTFRPDEKSDFPTTFYPSGKTPAQAIPIIVGRADKIKKIVFQLPPKVDARKIQGILLWSDGKPIPEADLRLLNVESGNYDSINDANKNGEFVLNGFDGGIYRLIAIERKSVGDTVREFKTESHVFTLDENTQTFKLVIEKPEDFEESGEDGDMPNQLRF